VLLGNSVLLWIGLRSYGIYLFHWPIYQGIREVTGRPLTVAEFVLALALTAVVCEVSYRLVEMPVRRRHVGRWWRRLQARRDPVPRRIIAAAGAGLVALSVFAATNLATAELKQNEIAQSLAEGEQSVTDLAGLTGTTTPAPVPPDTQVPTTPPTTTAPPASVPAAAGPGATVPPTAAPPTAAAPTVAPTTVPPTTLPPTTTEPPAPIQTLAIGDSVMLGAAPALRDAGVDLVDAAVSRQMVDMVPVVQALRDQRRLGDAVIVHLGTNGPIGDDTLTAFFDALKNVRRVLVLQVAAPGKAWIGPNNQKLSALPDRYPNVRVINWPELSTRCVDDCFYADGIHLKTAGQAFYAESVMFFLGR
jgi:hypothetical protein